MLTWLQHLRLSFSHPTLRPLHHQRRYHHKPYLATLLSSGYRHSPTITMAESPSKPSRSASVMSKLKNRFSTLSTTALAPKGDSSSTPANAAATADAKTPGQGAANDKKKQKAASKSAKSSAAGNGVAANSAPPAVPDKGEGVTPIGIDYRDAAHSLRLRRGLRDLYPEIEPFRTGFYKVDDRHELYWEISGNEKGNPVVFLHGGPGSGCGTMDRRWFDPKHYCIYLFDQRGAGRSKPHADLTNNTTWDVVRDIETLREHFGVDKWHVFGGSWGSCLALAYAQTHPDRVKSLVLRGIFTLRRIELQFFYQFGSSFLYPELFQPYRDLIPEAERGNMIAAYNKRLTSSDENERLEAAKRWTAWELSTCQLYHDVAIAKKADEDVDFSLAMARIECHYFLNEGWMEDGQLLKKENIDKIRSIPGVIVQGRYDLVCPAATAYELHAAWPEAQLHMVPDAGHTSREPGVKHHLVNATDKMRTIA